MSTSANAAQLVQVTKNFFLDWDQTRERWRDAKSREFEDQFLKEIPHHISHAVEAIDEISSLIGKVRKDCE